MHELSLAEHLRDILEEESRRQGFGRVHAVRLRVGRLSCVEPEAMRFCFQEVMRGSLAEGAVLEIHQVDGKGYCRRCERESDMPGLDHLCPGCQGPLQVTEGMEIHVEDLIVGDS